RPRPMLQPPKAGRIRARGTWVKEAQRLLVAAGHDLSSVGGIDGLYGPGMERAVRAFQKSRGLEVDGVVGPRTWAELLRHG
ncbi:MAG: peptidoglycan-binding protein, partial [Actinomycetota bacterium]|nr:peptidoglycan-binding protein [Actinomycetota bacterium]